MLSLRTCTVVLSLAAPAALACGWDYETFVAETGSLPCVEAVAVMRPPRHSPQLLQRKLDVAELALALVPSSLPAHDARTNALLHLGSYDAALASARARAALAPDDYASKANLGTALTFTGDLEAALTEVDAIVAKDPSAHFGREQFHAKLVRFLVELGRDPALARQRDFLGLSLSADEAVKGNPARVPPGALDALVSMLGVYGAAENPHVLYALGNVLALMGEGKLAFAAWKSALEKKHPAREVVVPLMKAINAAAHEAWKKNPNTRVRDDGEPTSKDLLNPAHWSFGDNWAGLWWSADKQRELWESRQGLVAQHEEKQLQLGLAHWTESGMQVLTTFQRRLGLRCPSVAAQASPSPGLFAPAGKTTATDAGKAWLAALEAVVSDVQDARSCEVVRPNLTARLEKTAWPKARVADRESVVADAATRERFLEVFDRLALVLSRCPQKGKPGNGPVLERWTKRLAP